MTRTLLSISLVANLVLGGALWFGWTMLDSILGPERHLRRQSQFELYARPNGGIVFVGDSITHGGIWTELLERDDVYNRGIGGDTTEGVLARIESIEALVQARLRRGAGQGITGRMKERTDGRA